MSAVEASPTETCAPRFRLEQDGVVHEHAKLTPEQREREILQPHHCPHPERMPWIAGRERIPRPAGGRAQEPGAVWRAADDTTKDDEIRIGNRVPVAREIGEEERRAIRDAETLGQGSSPRLVRRRHLDHGPTACPGTYQLGLNRADATPDVEHAAALQRGLAEPVEDQAGLAAKTFLQMTPERASRSSLTEERVARVPTAARSVHDGSIGGSSGV
jgi:hypothetical protein